MTGQRSSPSRLPTRASLVCLATAVAALLAPASAVSAHAAPVTSGPAATGIYTLRSSNTTYDVYVAGVRTAAVDVADPAYTVRTALSPKGDRLALILNVNGWAGDELRLITVANGQWVSVAKGRIASAVFGADGRLGFVRDGRAFVLAGHAAAKPHGTVPGAEPEVIGWTADGSGLLVQHHNSATMAPSLSRLDLSSGAVTPILASNPAADVVYRDFRIAVVAGQHRISAIRATHIYPCAGRQSTLVLADERGVAIKEVGTTPDSYRSAVWSPDGKGLAYEVQACVSPEAKAGGKAMALGRMETLNGLYVLDLAAGQSHRVVRGLSSSFPLSGYDGDTVRLASARDGVRTVAALATDAMTGDRLDAEAVPDVSIQAKIVPSVFIHQLWDTADNFNGNSACGPTSAVMDLASYQLPNQFGFYASWPSRHWSPYGGYVHSVYSAYGTTYNAYAPDPSYHYFAGAYGWMVDDPSVGSIHYWLRDYLDRHVSYAIAEAFTPSAAWIRSKIDGNLMVVVSGMFAYGLYGHIGIITGYTNDGRFYVNDPYGANTDGSYDGKNTIYTLDYMRGRAFWAA
jgi:hypothetical protein